MSNKRTKTPSHQQIFSWEVFHARTYQWPAAARDWLESEADYGLSSIAFLQTLNRDGLLSRTCPVFYPATAEKILPLSFAGWSSAGMASPGGYLTLNTLDWPSDAVVCSLSDVLIHEADPWVIKTFKSAREFQAWLRKYYLSPKAARGILRRAEKRGRELPEELFQSLKMLSEENQKTGHNEEIFQSE